MSNRFLAGITGAAILAIGVPASASAGTLTMSGSTSVYPLASSLSKAYTKKTHGKVKFKITQGGTDVGINDAARGNVSIGMASRDPLKGDPKGLAFSKIARDGICIITNKKNKLPNLSPDQVRQIFTGQTRSWKGIKGAKSTGTIDIVTRTSSSGTADAFQNIFLGGNLRIAGSASAKNSNGLVRQSVASNKDAVGFVSMDFLQGVSATPYRGVKCNLKSARSGQYKGVRNFWLVTKGAPSGDAKGFIAFAKSKTAKKITAKHWIPL
jgi:phosphate transport system substrate-binding protein